MESIAEPCTLCGRRDTALFHRDSKREYLICPECDLVFVPARFRLPPDEERRRYELHENAPDDPGYRAFLSKLVVPLVERLEPGARGLDFGSGPGPALSTMLRERGFETADYDPLFADDRSLLQARYDFVACTETAEHFGDPAKEFELIFDLALPGGTVAIMTQMRKESHDFALWHYTRDETHVCFYSKRTFEWMAARFGAALAIHGNSVAIFEKA